jgi:hypothetical protein
MKRPVVICAACLRESCAEGILMCEDARRASLIFAERAGRR